MPAKRLLPVISWWRINLLLYLVLACLAVFYRRDFLWAAHVLPGYMTGNIEMTHERLLCLQAVELIREGHFQDARGILQKSLAIDPKSESLYWLAECSYRTRQDQEALQQFENYLQIDPMLPETYLRISELLMKKNQPQQARQVLQKGLTWFARCVANLEPHTDPSVRLKYNLKAIIAHAKAERARNQMTEALARLD